MSKRVAAVQTLTLDGREYVVIPKADYLQMTGSAPVDAIVYAQNSIGATLRAAREKAGLTQAQLAKKLRKSQTLISQAESGNESVGEAFVKAVLKACGLPNDWKP